MELFVLYAIFMVTVISLTLGAIFRNTKATKENSRKQLEFLDYIARLLEEEFGKNKKNLAEDKNKSSN